MFFKHALVYIKEVLVSFTSTELKILRLLLQYPQKIFFQSKIYMNPFGIILMLMMMIR